MTSTINKVLVRAQTQKSQKTDRQAGVEQLNQILARARSMRVKLATINWMRGPLGHLTRGKRRAWVVTEPGYGKQDRIIVECPTHEDAVKELEAFRRETVQGPLGEEPEDFEFERVLGNDGFEPYFQRMSHDDKQRKLEKVVIHLGSEKPDYHPPR